MECAQKWAPILQLPGFEASDDGQIKNRFGRILKQWQESDRGTYRVRIKGRNRSVAFLVLSAHTGRPLVDGFYPRHWNKNRADNSVENLVWAGKAR